MIKVRRIVTMILKSINPTTQELIQEYPLHTEAEIHTLLDDLCESLKTTRDPDRYPIPKRYEILMGLADLLDRNTDQYARLITLEMGKTIVSARQEIKKCAWVCRYYAESLEKFLLSEPEVQYQPLGVLLAVMPWNFPFWQILRVAAPQIAVGNPILLKHASNVTGCAQQVEELIQRATGENLTLLKHVRIPGSALTQWISDPRIQAVTLTGSENAGISVARAAGENLKKTVLELGGSDPFLVSHHADVKEAAHHAAKSRLINAGQSCIAAKRFIIENSVWDQFVSELKSQLQKINQGDPLLETTELGPLQSQAAAHELQNQLQRAEQQGCVPLFELPVAASIKNPSAFAAIRLLDASRSSFREELFGPVALLYRARDWDHAIEIGNQSDFGLSSSIWTRDPGEAKRAQALLQAGSVFLNTISASDPRLPFGGIKRSGYGRELGVMGIREFANIKTCVGKI